MSLHFGDGISRPADVSVNTYSDKQLLYFSGENVSFEKMTDWLSAFLEKEISEEFRIRIIQALSEVELTHGYNVFSIRIKFWFKVDDMLTGIPMTFHKLDGMEFRTDAVLVLIRYWLTNTDLVSEDDPRLKFLDNVLKR